MPVPTRACQALIVALMACVPRIATACPACFAASDDRVTRMYFASGILLSVLPLAIIGGIARWWWRRFAAGEET